MRERLQKSCTSPIPDVLETMHQDSHDTGAVVIAAGGGEPVVREPSGLVKGAKLS